MTCDVAQQNMVMVQYGELLDELQMPLEQHISTCENCRREWNALQALDEALALMPVTEPSPNLLASARVRLDEALDTMPPRSLASRFTSNMFRWLGTMQGAPALTTLLLGAGFLGGNILTRYQVAHQPHLPSPVIISNPANGAIASVSGIVQTPDSEQVQVNYNRLVPETVQGSLDDPQIRSLLLLGTKLATNNDVHASSVSLLANECIAGHGCDGDAGGASGNIRGALLHSARYDKSATVRMKALEGLQPYVGQDQRVRDAVLEVLMHDSNPEVRARAISLLDPVQADSSVRQVLRTVSTQDANPAIRTASFEALRGTADIQ